MNSLYPWQSKALKLVTPFLRAKKMPQTLLFYGLDGLGVDEFITHFLANFLSIDVNAVPNYLYLDTLNAVDEKVSVEDIRMLQARLKQTARIHEPKIVLINPVSALNLASSNALLKILEDAPKDTYFLLRARSLHEVLPTILSRCVKVFFQSATYDEFQQYLGPEQGGRERYLLTGGAPLQVEHWAESGLFTLYENLKSVNLAKMAPRQKENLEGEFKALSFVEVFLLFETLTREKLSVIKDLTVIMRVFHFYEFILAQKAFYNKQYHLNKERFVSHCLMQLMELEV